MRSVPRSKGETDDLAREVILGWVGPDVEGGRERRRDWNGGLQRPSGLKCSRRRLWSEASYRRCHGESRGVHASQDEVGAGTLCMKPKSARTRVPRFSSAFSCDDRSTGGDHLCMLRSSCRARDHAHPSCRPHSCALHASDRDSLTFTPFGALGSVARPSSSDTVPLRATSSVSRLAQGAATNRHRSS